MVALLADTTCHGNGLRSPASVLQGMYATKIPNNYGNALTVLSAVATSATESRNRSTTSDHLGYVTEVSLVPRALDA